MLPPALQPPERPPVHETGEHQPWPSWHFGPAPYPWSLPRSSVCLEPGRGAALPRRMNLEKSRGLYLGWGIGGSPGTARCLPGGPGERRGGQPGRTGDSELSAINPGTITRRSFTSDRTKCLGGLGQVGEALLRALATFRVLRRF